MDGMGVQNGKFVQSSATQQTPRADADADADTFFAIELGYIQNDVLRTAVRNCLASHLMELIATPASRRFHPLDERGKFGAIIHFKRVAWFCKCIEEELHLPAEDMDALYAAALLHDLAKIKIYTIVDGTTLADEDIMSIHPLISAQLAAPFLTAIEPELTGTIMKLIKTHMGFWYRKCPVPENELERLFCMADYIVSRTECVIDVGFKNPIEND